MEHRDTTAPQGERVTAGLRAAATRGRRGGRPRVIGDEQLAAIRAVLDGGMSEAAACRTFGVERTTLIEALRGTG